MLNFIKKIFSIFLIFNLTFVSSAQAAATFVDSFGFVDQENTPRGLTFNNDGTINKPSTFPSGITTNKCDSV